MNRTALNLVMDVAAGLLLLAMVLTGLVLRFALPPGTNKEFMLWGLMRHEWGSVHFWVSAALLAALAVHVALHWQWLVTVIGKRVLRSQENRPPLTVKGIVFAALLLGGAGVILAAAYWGRTEIAGPTDEGAPASWISARAVLLRNCIGCHGDDGAGNFRILYREDYFRPGAALVVPGDSAGSELIAILSGRRPEMPMAQRHRLSEEDLAVIRHWIDSGAD